MFSRDSFSILIFIRAFPYVEFFQTVLDLLQAFDTMLSHKSAPSLRGVTLLHGG